MSLCYWTRLVGLCHAGMTERDLHALGALYGARHWSRIAYRVTAGGEA